MQLEKNRLTEIWIACQKGCYVITDFWCMAITELILFFL